MLIGRERDLVAVASAIGCVRHGAKPKQIGGVEERQSIGG